MRIARIAAPTGPRHVVQDTDRWLEIADPFAAQPRFTGNEYPVGTVRLLAPVQPMVVLGMAHNGPGDRDTAAAGIPEVAANRCGTGRRHPRR